MTTNAGIVSDALKYVTQKTEQLNTLQKLDDRIDSTEAAKEEEATTNGTTLQGFSNTSTVKKDAMGYDAITTYPLDDGLGINALPDSRNTRKVSEKTQRVGQEH